MILKKMVGGGIRNILSEVHRQIVIYFASHIALKKSKGRSLFINKNTHKSYCYVAFLFLFYQSDQTKHFLRIMRGVIKYYISQ